MLHRNIMEYYFSEHIVIGIWNNNQAKQIIWQSKDVIRDKGCFQFLSIPCSIEK